MKLKKEIPILIIIIIPLIYLAYIWNTLPEIVPTHWNIKGVADNWENRSSLILKTFFLSGLTYLIFSLIPLIDPKKKIKEMGNKYDNLKFVIVFFMSAIAVVKLYDIKNPSLASGTFVLIAIGILFIIHGNYMKTIKANYFIGIRTPWTLENESVWKKTHVLAGKLWFLGGLAIVTSSLTTNKEFNGSFFLIVITTIVLIPIIYSYVEYKKLKLNRIKNQFNHSTFSTKHL